MPFDNDKQHLLLAISGAYLRGSRRRMCQHVPNSCSPIYTSASAKLSRVSGWDHPIHSFRDWCLFLTHSCSYKRRIQWTKSPVSWDVHPCHQHQLHPAPASPGEIWALPGWRVRDGTRKQAVCIFACALCIKHSAQTMQWNGIIIMRISSETFEVTLLKIPGCFMIQTAQ